jgi:hypothetical protein
MLNDSNGCERDPATGTYFTEAKYCHRILYNNAVVPAAKRPASKPDGTPLPSTAIVWRPVALNTPDSAWGSF